MTGRLDPCVSATIRGEIDRRFYAKVNDQADLLKLVHDPDFGNAGSTCRPLF